MRVMTREDRKRRRLLFKEALTTPWLTPWLRKNHKRRRYDDYLTTKWDLRPRRKLNVVYASAGYVDTVFSNGYRNRYANVLAKVDILLFPTYDDVEK